MHKGNEARALAFQRPDGARPIRAAMGNQQMYHRVRPAKRLMQGAAPTPQPLPRLGFPRQPPRLPPGALRRWRALP